MHYADASPFTLLVLIMHDGLLNLDKELRLSDLLLLFHTHKDSHTHAPKSQTHSLFVNNQIDTLSATDVTFWWKI